MTRRFARIILWPMALAVLVTVTLAPRQRLGAQMPLALDTVLNALTFRNLGPFRTAAWVTEIAVPETTTGYRIYEQKLHGTESMINYLKSLKNELDEW
jgi:hypothetical protein